MLDKLVKPAYAQITNPAISEKLGGNATDAQTGKIFTIYFLNIWKMMIGVGSLMVIIFFVWGSILWISGGDDAAKIGKARDKMVQAVIGLIILVSSFTIIEFISTLFFGGDFSILNIDFGI